LKAKYASITINFLPANSVSDVYKKIQTLLEEAEIKFNPIINPHEGEIAYKIIIQLEELMDNKKLSHLDKVSSLDKRH